MVNDGARISRECRFSTARLTVTRLGDAGMPSLPARLVDILSPAVTAALPPGWQHVDSIAAATEWLADRLAEGAVLVAQPQDQIESNDVVGLMLLHEDDATGEVRIGYLLAHEWWGRGLATEMIAGLVNWCRGAGGVRRLVGVVARTNPASARVLQRNGFTAAAPDAPDATEDPMEAYVLDLTAPAKNES